MTNNNSPTAQRKAQVDKFLTEVSNGIFPQGYIGDLVFPKIAVKQKTGLIGGYTNQHLRETFDLMVGEAPARRIDPVKYTDIQYSIKSHGLSGVVTSDDYANVEAPFDAESDKTIGLTHLIKTNKELSLSSVLFNTSTWGANTASPSTKFNAPNSDPLGVAATAKSAIVDSVGIEPNALIIDIKTAIQLRKNEQILDTLGFNFARAGQLSNADLARAFGIPEENLLIANVPYNVSKEGQADSISQVWGDSMLFYIKPNGPAKQQLTLGYHMELTGRGQQRVYKNPLGNPPDSNEIIVVSDYQHLLVNTACGYLISDTLS